MFGRIESYLTTREVKRIFTEVNEFMQDQVGKFGPDEIDTRFSLVIELRRPLSAVSLKDFDKQKDMLLREVSGYKISTEIYNVSSLAGFIGVQAKMHATLIEGDAHAVCER